MTIHAKVEIGNILIDNLSFSEAVERIIELAREKHSYYVVTPNADHVVRYQEDAKFQAVYQKAALVVADGMPLVWGSKWLGTPLQARVTGADLLPALCTAAAKAELSVYFLGAPAGVGQQAADNMLAINPKLAVVGVYSPPFGFEQDATECAHIIQQINAAQPDIVFVGLGSPKQEFWMADTQTELKVGVMLGIGAAIAFAAGTEKRAPKLMQNIGLEWLHRLLSDPKRLAKRYAKDFKFFTILRETRRRQRQTQV